MSDPESIGVVQDAKIEFARKLSKWMSSRGFGNVDVVRGLALHGVKAHPSLISGYRRGRYLPSPARIEALSKVLGVSASELMPPINAVLEAPRGFELAPLSDGRVRLRVHQTVSIDQARAVALILGEDADRALSIGIQRAHLSRQEPD
ncbi:hypothetical protein [Falsiroseomonas oryzae]|uniref:hypothetical protein n=1 Tax=Falsiroseomonas oryzae TaxID=2766473 RepID=UPI0022EB0240|nr:hypothetical protein [Roseomonas sp. MO-31]